MKIQAPFYLVALILALAIFGWGVFYASGRLTGGGLWTDSAITNFAQCAAVGYPIMESYPRQCRTPEGVTFVEETNREPAEGPAAAPPAYYGSSTGGPCQKDDDCQVAGCNQEICQGRAEEERFSICILPDKPTPGDLGLACVCVDDGCQWAQP